MEQRIIAEPSDKPCTKQTFRICTQFLDERIVFYAALTVPQGIGQRPALGLDCTHLFGSRSLFLGGGGVATTHIPRTHCRSLPSTVDSGQQLPSQDGLQPSPSGMHLAEVVGRQQARSTRHGKRAFGWPAFPRRKDAVKGESILLSRCPIEGMLQECGRCYVGQSSCQGKQIQN